MMSFKLNSEQSSHFSSIDVGVPYAVRLLKVSDASRNI